jgi:hypothetical protein
MWRGVNPARNVWNKSNFGLLSRISTSAIPHVRYESVSHTASFTTQSQEISSSYFPGSNGSTSLFRPLPSIFPLPHRERLHSGTQQLYAKKKGSTEALAELYQKKSPIEHVLLRPDTYVGSTQPTESELWIYDEKLKRMVRKHVKYVPGLYKIFDEILVNASDNRQRDYQGTSEIRVDIDVENGTISIFNNGQGIPVAIHPSEQVGKILLPHCIHISVILS